MTFGIITLSYAECCDHLNIMLSVVMLNVIILRVVAPIKLVFEVPFQWCPLYVSLLKTCCSIEFDVEFKVKVRHGKVIER
jgi:hypothetical protein